jgi:SAM-dependent methyltransferase
MHTPLKVWINLRRPTAADFDQIYRTSRWAPALPWYHPEVPKLLAWAIHQRARCGRALDIGCGDGSCSVYLARAGYQVTSLDFAKAAIEMTGGAARSAGVKLDVVWANVLNWSNSERFDLILDSSCLHVRAFRNADRPRYKEQLLKWLGDEGDYILVHFDRMGPFDWRPVGPRRRSRREILRFFSPELVEHATDFCDRNVPLPVGPVVRERAYWFQRS